MYLPSSTHRRRRRHRLLVRAVALGVIGTVAVISWVLALLTLTHPTTHSAHGPSAPRHPSPPAPACPGAALPPAVRPGTVAWVEASGLRVVDLRTCRQTILLPSGAAPPVRFSPDGQWVAFGDGRVVSSLGGAVSAPLGAPVRAWRWSPRADLVAGVTTQGAVLIGGPGRQAAALVPAGSGARDLAFAPDGRHLAIDRAGRGIQVLDVATGRARTVLPEPDPALVPEVAGWSPDGRWVLYWRGPVGKAGGPLDAVPAEGGPWVNVFNPVLPYPDFLASCGNGIALTAGAGQAVSVGKQILLTGPPAWRFRNLTSDYSRSWMWPACSPDGLWLAATDSVNQKESAERTVPRALWLLALNGSSRRLLVPGTGGGPEFPRWSPDGAVILVVLRSGNRWSSSGSLVLVQVDPRSGRMVKHVGPLADLGSAPGPGGHQQWAGISDWYRP